jgi:quinol monooxygenase YgiN
MFARLVEFTPKLEKKEELIKTIKNEILPILKKQAGFLEFLPFVPEVTTEKFITITLWTEKKDAERYVRETFMKVEEILKPYMTTPIVVKPYMIETKLAEHFVAAVAA